MIGKNVIYLSEYSQKRRNIVANGTPSPENNSVDMASKKQSKPKDLFQSIQENPDAAVLRRRHWERAATEVLRAPVTLKQFYLKMLLKGIEEPDINLWWLYEWQKEGKVVARDDGYFQLAEHILPKGK